MGEKLLLLLKNESISETYISTSKAYFLSPHLTLASQREREKYMRILHLSKPRCKALQGFFFGLCLNTSPYTEDSFISWRPLLWITSGPFVQKLFMLYTGEGLLLAQASPNTWALNSQATGFKVTSYNLQIRGEPGEQALPYLYIISLPLWTSRHKNSTLLHCSDLQFWVPYG